MSQASAKKVQLKWLPSLEFIQQLEDICSYHQENQYDRTIHRLTIVLKDKYHRSEVSFTRQLKMLGFRIKKSNTFNNYEHKNQIIQQNNLQPYQPQPQQTDPNKIIHYSGFQPHQKNIFPTIVYNVANRQSPLKPTFMKHQVNLTPKHPPIIYKWRGKKELLLNYELTSLESSLKTSLQKNQQISKNLQSRKEAMDGILEKLLFKIMINPTNIDKDYHNTTLDQMKEMVNGIQKECAQMVNDGSDILANQLQIYRLLVFRDGHSSEDQKDKEKYSLK